MNLHFKIEGTMESDSERSARLALAEAMKDLGVTNFTTEVDTEGEEDDVDEDIEAEEEEK